MSAKTSRGWTGRLGRLVILFGLGWAGGYFADPDRGHSRRVCTADQLRAKLRRRGRRAEQSLHYAKGKVKGTVARTEGAGQVKPVDDRAVVDAIKQVLSGLDLPTTDVVIDVVEGIATLRGQLDDLAQVRQVEVETLKAPGVSEVLSYLHLPGSPAPNKAASLTP